MPRQVIDACALLYDRDCWRVYLDRLAADAPEYLSVFAAPLTAHFGADPEAVRAAVTGGGAADVARVLAHAAPARVDLPAHLSELDRQGVAGQILHGWPGRTADGTPVNDRLAAIAAKAPDRLRAWAGLAMTDPDEVVAELLRCGSLGMTGCCVFPFLDGVDVTDPRWDPVFATAVDLGLPVWLHTGNHFNARLPIDICNWRTVDRLAVRHPDLVIVAGHGGWPQILEMVAVARRHPNVHLEFSSHRPRAMARPGSGWEPLLCHGRTTVRHKVLFGSCTWVQPVPVPVLADEVAALGLGDAATDAWLYGNAAALFGFDRAARP